LDAEISDLQRGLRAVAVIITAVPASVTLIVFVDGGILKMEGDTHSYGARLAHSVLLIRDSILLLKRNPPLSFFLVTNFFLIGGISIFAIGFILYRTFLFDTGYFASAGVFSLIAVYLIWVVNDFIGLLLMGAMANEIYNVSQGGSAKVKRGLRASWNRKKELFIVAILSTVFFAVLRILEKRIGRIANLFEIGLSLAMFFLLPVIVLRPRSGIRESIKLSASIFKENYGETSAVVTGAGVVGFIFMLPAVLIGLIVAISTGAIIIYAIILFLTLLFTILVGTALNVITSTVMYTYATEGEKPQEFRNVDFEVLLQPQGD
jgi:hypothetical protein